MAAAAAASRLAQVSAQVDSGGGPRFTGWIGYDRNAVGNLKYGEFTPKTWTEDDVDIQITHCGICYSDISTLSSHWGPAMYPQGKMAIWSFGNGC